MAGVLVAGAECANRDHAVVAPVGAQLAGHHVDVGTVLRPRVTRRVVRQLLRLERVGVLVADEEAGADLIGTQRRRVLREITSGRVAERDPPRRHEAVLLVLVGAQIADHPASLRIEPGRVLDELDVRVAAGPSRHADRRHRAGRLAEVAQRRPADLLQRGVEVARAVGPAGGIRLQRHDYELVGTERLDGGSEFVGVAETPVRDELQRLALEDEQLHVSRPLSL